MEPFTIRNGSGTVIGTVYERDADLAMSMARRVYPTEQNLTVTPGVPPSEECYVLGLDGHGKVTMMTSTCFSSEQRARFYAQGCASGRKAFVVRRVS